MMNWWTMTTWLTMPMGRQARPCAKNGWVGGTNIKGQMIKFNYSLTDALTFTFTAYINELIKPA